MIESRSAGNPLLEAAALAGGVRALARRLRVPTKQLGSWLDGEAETPATVVQRAVAFVQRAFDTPAKSVR